MQTNKIVKGPGVRCSCLARAVCCVLRCRAIRCRGAHLLMRMTFVKSQQVVDAVAQRHGAASKRCPITKSRGVPWAGSKLPSMISCCRPPCHCQCASACGFEIRRHRRPLTWKGRRSHHPRRWASGGRAARLVQGGTSRGDPASCSSSRPPPASPGPPTACATAGSRAG